MEELHREGLSATEAARRREQGLGNLPPSSPARSEREIVLGNIFTFFNFIFLGLAVWLVLVGSSVKNMAFLGVVFWNTVIGIYQEIRAKRAVDALTLVSQPTAKVLRDGAETELPQQELVQGDVVLLRTGDQLSADGTLIDGELQMNEAMLTGESDGVTKQVGDTVLSGSFVMAGAGKAVLTQVGGSAYAARLAREAKADPRPARSEMMRALDTLLKGIGIALIPVGGLLFYQQLQELTLRQASENTVAAVVGMIPEGLYLLCSVALAASSYKLTRRRVLVQDLHSIETLARVDVLCVDKTGTITESKMEVFDLLPLGEDSPEYLEAVLSALSSQPGENDTGRALAAMYGSKSDWVCTDRIPFQSKYKWAAASFENQGSFVIGAPDSLLGERYEEIRSHCEDYSAQGHRVLLLAAYGGKPVPGALDGALLRPMALIALSNPIRQEAPETFRYFAEQGVQVKVISGDNPVTVSRIAAEAGIAGAERYVDASKLDEEALKQAAEEYCVFGRVTPEQKRLLVQSLQAAGHTVAMTGDGVNDVLAMKDADCSIAVAGGAQAASQIAKLVLSDGDFSAMPQVVAEGRRVINNIQRAAALFLVKNIFSLLLSLATLLTGYPYPVVPIHLTVISGLTIGIPSFLLAFEPNYERVQGRFVPGVLQRALPGGLTNVFVVLVAQAFMDVYGISGEEASTVCAAILGVVGLLVLYHVCRPFDRFRILIWWGMTASLVLSFTLLGGFFELKPGNPAVLLLMFVLLMMIPTVYGGVRYLGGKLEPIWRKWREHHAHL